MREIFLLNGPNLGVLGRREPEIYGTTTLPEIVEQVRTVVIDAGFELVAFDANAEGTLIDLLAEHRHAAGALVNPGALMIYGRALADALVAYPAPWIEVHLTNVWRREEFRHFSVTAGSAAGVVMGFGASGYVLACRALLEMLSAGTS